MGDNIAIDTSCFLGIPLQVAGGEDDFTSRIYLGLAVFERDQCSQIFLVLQDELVPATQDA